MKQWELGAIVTVSAYTIVEAETKEEAIKIASERTVEIGASFCNREDAKEVWIVEEADGEAVGITCDDD